MCKYIEVENLIKKYDLPHCEYQEAYNETVEDLARAIFKLLNLCEECGQKVGDKNG